MQKQKKLSAAQQLGHDSYHAGLRPTDNPYTGPSNTAWSRCYDAAKAEGPPDPTAVDSDDAEGLRRDALYNRATIGLEKAALHYLEALRKYRASGGQHMNKHELYESMLRTIEELIGEHHGYARPEDADSP